MAGKFRARMARLGVVAVAAATVATGFVPAVQHANAEPQAVAAENSSVKVKLFDYRDSRNIAGPAVDAGKKNVNHATVPSAIANWGASDFYAGFQFNGTDARDYTGDWNKWSGKWQNKKGDVYQGIVKNKLGSDGYPEFSDVVNNVTANGSERNTAYLFTESDYAKAFEVKNPDEFLSKNGNNYSFDSSKNFAEYDQATGNMTLTRPNQAALDDPNDNPQFAPFDTLPENGSLEGMIGGNENANYAFGMTVEATFRQPQNGQVTNEDGSKSNMVFNFSGDDDVWLYIDGALVLDIGGIHDASSGSIDFATGKVIVTAAGGQKHETTLLAMMKEVHDSAWIEANMQGNTFKDFSNHEMKFFYLERGHGGSNCKLDFNLETIPEGTIGIYKNIKESNTANLSDAEFLIQVDIARTDNASAQPSEDEYEAYVGSYQLYGADGQPIGEPQQTNEKGQFKLKNGQHALLLDNIKATDWYKVTELDSNGYDTDDYEFNIPGAEVTGKDGEIIGQSKPIQVAKNPTATVNNTFTAKDKYAFVVDKQMVSGQTAPEGAEFTVRVTAVDAEGNETPYNGKYQKDGSTNPNDLIDVVDGYITLTVDHSAKIVDLNPGTTLKVVETLPENGLYNQPTYADNDATADADKADGMVTVDSDNQIGTITVTNSLKTVPAKVENQIHIKKTVSGRSWNEGEQFGFTLSPFSYQEGEDSPVQTGQDVLVTMPMPDSADLTLLKPNNGSNEATGTFGVIEFKKAGVYTYKIVENGPSGESDLVYSKAEYEVVVTVSGPDASTAELSAIVEVRKVKDDAGKDTTGVVSDKTAAFVNSVKPGTLTLTKNVAGTAANKDQHFTFSIENLPAGKYEGEFANVEEGGSNHPKDIIVSADGIARVQLKHGETVTIKDLPGNTVLNVKENVKGLQVGKTEAKTGENGESVNVTANEGADYTDDYSVTVPSDKTAAVTFTNTTDFAPNLGISANSTLPAVGAAAAAIAGGTVLAVIQRKRNAWSIGDHARKE